VVVRTSKESPETELKDLIRVLDDEPILSDTLLQMAQWISDYYFAPLGEAIRIMLPPGLLSRKEVDLDLETGFWPVRTQLAVVAVHPGEIKLTVRQAEAVSSLQKCAVPVFVQAFSRQTGISTGLLRTLQEKGVLSLKKVNQDRSPWKFWAGETDEPVRHSLTEAQEGVFEGILRDLESSEFRTTLLHGVTGSGKTEIYLNAIAQVLDSGKSALMLVPEIGLTPQVSRAFRSWFKDSVAILHSGLSDGERFDQWRLIRSGECRVVVGTRSAVFAPLEKLGIIIVDEEHDTSYKQEETPRYHGRDAAIKRGQLENSLVLLGSATPQLEIFHKAKDRKDFGFQTLPSRILDRSLPTVHVVDMREEFQRHGKQQLISGFLEGLVRGRVEKRQ
jgi:primosomal protein N' (replication factor Y)